jgi:hypothetical protein
MSRLCTRGPAAYTLRYRVRGREVCGWYTKNLLFVLKETDPTPAMSQHGSD